MQILKCYNGDIYIDNKQTGQKLIRALYNLLNNQRNSILNQSEIYKEQ